MKTLRYLWTQHKLALLALVAASGALAYFAVTSIAAFIYWMDPAHQDQPLAGWMTPQYVGQSYHLPREIIEEAFFLERGKNPPRVRISDIAEQNNLTIADLQARIDAAQAAFEAERTSRQGSRDDD